MKRILILGSGGAGKSTFAAKLALITGLPVIELDAIFWGPGPTPTSPHDWAAVQEELVRQPEWILDGDLGPYDVLDRRLGAADTVIVLDFSRWRCGWRAWRRSPERADFWRWLWTWRRDYRPLLLADIAAYAGQADVYLPRSPRDLERLERALIPPLPHMKLCGRAGSLPRVKPPDAGSGEAQRNGVP